MSKQTNSGGGIGFFGVLGIVFITLKLIDIEPVAGWSWWWVTAPLWGPVLAAVGILVLIGIVVFTVKWIGAGK